MKKILCASLSTILLFVSTVSNIYASTDDEIEVYYNRKNDIVTVNGEVSGIDEETIFTYYSISSADEISDNTNAADLKSDLTSIGQSKTDENGRFSFSYPYNSDEQKNIENIFITVDGRTLNNSVDIKSVLQEASGYDKLLALPTGLNKITETSNKNDDGISTKVKDRFDKIRDEYGTELPVIESRKPTNINTIYVSNEGDDSVGDGSVDNPYKSLSKAISVAKENTAIYLRQGKYYINESISIAKMNNLYIGAYSGEKVVISSGNRLDAAKFSVSENTSIPESARGKVYEYDLKDTEMDFTKSEIDLKLLNLETDYELARYPKSGTTGMLKVPDEEAEVYPNGKSTGVYDAGPWDSRYNTNVTETRDTGRYGTTGFEFKIEDAHPILWNDNSRIFMKGSFYAEYITNTVQVSGFDADKQSVKTIHTKWTSPRGARYKDDNKFYYFNVLDELDEPGEWKVDLSTKKLYVYPVGGLDDFIIQQPKYDGNNPSAVFDIKGAENLTISDIGFENLTAPPIKISDNSTECLVQKCSFDNIKSTCVNIDSSKYCGVIRSEFTNCTAGNVISLNCEGSVNSLEPQYNFVQNNTFSECGQVRLVGVMQIVSHNRFNDIPTNSVYFLRTRDCYVEYNEFYNSPTEIIDGGVIYGFGYEGNLSNHIRYNYFDRCSTGRKRPFVIYMDEMSGYNNIYGNIITGGGQIYMNNGSENTVYNNIISGNTINDGEYKNDNWSIEDSMNYIYASSSRQNWYDGMSTGTGKFEYLYDGKYEEFDISAYNNRYPSFVKIADLMKQRAEEYKSTNNTNSQISITFSNGNDTKAYLDLAGNGVYEEVDGGLDYYLRYPRDNYIANNVILSDLDETVEGQKELRILDSDTKATGLIMNNIIYDETGYNTLNEVDKYYNNLRKHNAALEEIPFDKIGILSDFGASIINVDILDSGLSFNIYDKNNSRGTAIISFYNSDILANVKMEEITGIWTDFSNIKPDVEYDKIKIFYFNMDNLYPLATNITIE